MKESSQLSFPNFIEYIGGDVYNKVIMTKPLSKRDVENLFVERLYVLEYRWNPVDEPPPPRKIYLRGICKDRKQK